MLVIHGIWAHGVLSLWAEDSDQPAAVPSGQPHSSQGRPPRPLRAPRPHPFAASTGLLADVLAEFGERASDLARKAADDELTLWLPGTGAGPVASPSWPVPTPVSETLIAGLATSIAHLPAPRRRRAQPVLAGSGCHPG